MFRVFYEGEPEDYTVNIGDSPTNDGAGGDNFTTTFSAEVEVKGEMIRAFSATWPPTETGQVDRLMELQPVPLADSMLEIEVCDQTFRFSVDPQDPDGEGLSGSVFAKRAQNLFAIHDAPGDSPQADHKIYAAFNRVIHRRNGEPHQGRAGSGVRRVELYLSP